MFHTMNATTSNVTEGFTFTNYTYFINDYINLHSVLM